MNPILSAGIPFDIHKYADFIQNIDSKLKGFQILREFIRFNNYGPHFVKQFIEKYDIGENGKVRINNFRQALISSISYFFTKIDIEEIIIEAPKEDDDFILYEHLYMIVERAREPQTRFCMVNQYCLKYFDGKENRMEEASMKLKTIEGNFFESRESYHFFKHNLGQLEIDMLRDDWKDTKIKLEEEEDEIVQNNEDQSIRIMEERQNRRKQEQNNQFIIRNFPIKLAREIFLVTKPDGYTSGPQSPEQIQQQLCKALKLRDNNEAKEQYLFMEDFQKLFNSPKYRQLMELNLTEDECDLFYSLMWQSNNYKVMTMQNFLDYVVEQKELTTQELIKIAIGYDKQKKQEVKYDLVPRLFRELVKFAHQYGPTFLEQSMKPLQESRNNKDGFVELGNLRLYYKSLLIKFNDHEMNDLKIYLSQNSVVSLDKLDKKNFLSATCYVDCELLMKLIETQNEAIAAMRVGDMYRKTRTKDQARNIVQSSLIRGVVERMLGKVRGYKDENNMIDEIKLRQIIADMFPEINQQHLDLVFDKLEHNSMPSKYLTQKKIYVPEFAGFLLSGQVFEDHGQQNVDEEDIDSGYIENTSQIDQQNIAGNLIGQQQQQQQLQKTQMYITNQTQNTQQHEDDFDEDFDEDYPDESVNKSGKPQNNNYLNNQIQPQQEKMGMFQSSKKEKIQLNIPKKSGFVLNEPEKAFTLIQNNKTDIYKNFYQELKNQFVPEKYQKYLSEKDQLEKALMELKKLLQHHDTGEGVIKFYDFKQVITNHFNKLQINEVNYIIGEAQDNCAIQNTILAEPQFQRKKPGSDQSRSMLGKTGKNISNNNNSDSDISYSWFIMYISKQIQKNA